MTEHLAQGFVDLRGLGFAPEHILERFFYGWRRLGCLKFGEAAGVCLDVIVNYELALPTKLPSKPKQRGQ